MTHIQTTLDNGIATLTLNNPDSHNAFDDRLIADLTAALQALDKNPEVRVLVLAAIGKSFSAGADLGWMQRMAQYDETQNIADARALAELMRSLNEFSKPTVARVQGSAFGGGVGLIACCDIAVGVYDAQFALSEARLGLIPAVISPYVIAAIGARQARRYFLSGERFDAEQAQAIGLLHKIGYADELDAMITEIVDALLECGPAAQTACKQLIQRIAHGDDFGDLVEFTAQAIAKTRSSSEGREGVQSFLQKRSPGWLRKKA